MDSPLGHTAGHQWILDPVVKADAARSATPPGEPNAPHRRMRRNSRRGHSCVNLFLSLFVLLIGAAPPIAPCADNSARHPESDSAVVRVMTYNIRFDNPDDGIHAWANRRSEFLSFIVSQRIDILCIQEGLHGQVMFLKDGQPGFDVRGVGRDDGKEKGEYAAIFFNAARFSCLRDGTFWLSPQPEIPTTGWDAALPRIVTWVRLYDFMTKKALLVFNTHFDHRGVQARENSARLLLAKVREIGGNAPVVVAGDFNATEDEPPYRILLSREGEPPHLADALHHSRTPPQGPGSTFTGFELKEPEPGNRIDYLFVSDAVEVRSHRTVIARSTHGYLSDHLPVVAELLLP